MIREFKRRLGLVEFDLEFNYRVTMLGGMSGSGKTYLYNRLQNFVLSNKDDKIKCFNADDLFKIDILKTIKQFKDKFIVIDNGDLIVKDALRKHIASDRNNQYLIFGRNAGGMGLPPQAVGKLIIENGKGYIDYPKIFL